MEFFTIHDAICVKESDGEIVKAVMEKVSQDLYGEKISVKIENSSQDNVKWNLSIIWGTEWQHHVPFLSYAHKYLCESIRFHTIYKLIIIIWTM